MLARSVQMMLKGSTMQSFEPIPLFLRLCQTAAAGGDERPHTEKNIDQAKESESCFILNGSGVWKRCAVGETDDINGCGNHAEEDQQRNRDGDMHPQHAFL